MGPGREVLRIKKMGKNGESEEKESENAHLYVGNQKRACRTELREFGEGLGVADKGRFGEGYRG